ncbi:MAG: bifunctional diguanylate cyclase/phosphohydrolase [Candidatus Limnocylindria bacterium]
MGSEGATNHEAAGPARRPALLGLVVGVTLVLAGVTASALAVVATTHVETSTLTSVVSRDASLVELFVNGNLEMSDLVFGSPDTERVDEISRMLDTLAIEDAILRIEIRDLDGRVLFSSATEVVGTVATSSEGMASALGGRADAILVESESETDAVGTLPAASSYVQEYLPIMAADRRPLGVVGLWRDASELAVSLDAARNDVALVTAVAGALLAVVLFFVFRAAQVRLTRQHDQLLDATRRDPLTGMWNHGHIVATLVDEIEAARLAGGRIGLALVDVDNFRLFNDTHGHRAADELLLRVAHLVTAESREGDFVARYGPDEFLVVRPGATVEDVKASMERLRAELADVAVQYGESESLPVSVSIGIGAYPEHSASVTELLSATAIALGEAKASGGDGVRVVNDRDDGPVSGSFDVLQGLVIAVDTKDHYTKRHSEDVARYAAFLARRLGFDEELQRTISLAGLLHDVGKIGIPDMLLRKPSKLTADEHAVFQQHVALGDAIVRDVPNLDQVRAGIRYHHERWDGQGYLAGLDGDEIPIIGRVLAVADAFSAMTTTRPYRKALDVSEALKRLGDAAGTQLEEGLVKAFIEGIETAADAPLPGEEVVDAIWRPQLWVA